MSLELGAVRAEREERRYATRSRARIVELLRLERRYLTAATIARLLETGGKRIALSTVYRTLDLLVSLGIASRRTGADGEQSYVACTGDHHHHAVCRQCGVVEEVGCAAMERFAVVLREHHAFELDEHSVEFYGRCVRCR
jgi:Fur family ferric uptake transcriptional regulator